MARFGRQLYANQNLPKILGLQHHPRFTKNSKPNVIYQVSVICNNVSGEKGHLHELQQKEIPVLQPHCSVRLRHSIYDRREV